MVANFGRVNEPVVSRPYVPGYGMLPAGEGAAFSRGRGRSSGWPARTTSPDVTELAFVEAPASSAPGFPQNVVASWYATHTLWILRGPGGAARQVPGTHGATAPVWSANGKSLLYQAADALWLLPALPGTPVRIAAALFPVDNWPTYYGEVDWAQQFDWSAAR